MTYISLRGNVAVTKMKHWLKKSGIALRLVGSPPYFLMILIRLSGLTMLWVLALLVLRP